MMKLSSTSDYGIRALVDLAQHNDGAPVPSAEIAERQGIPGSLAGQVLGRLRASGFISSARGSQGGHQLAQAPDEIRLDRVVEALEGPLTLAACLERGAQNGRAAERCTGAARKSPSGTTCAPPFLRYWPTAPSPTSPPNPPCSVLQPAGGTRSDSTLTRRRRL